MTDLSNLPTSTILLGDIGLTILQLMLFFVSFWLIFVILIQRGKGGGLTAAFGGGGGDSAFGAKAGDAFTWITIWSSLLWITLCMVTIAVYNPPDSPENPFAQVDEQTMEETSPSMGTGSMSSGEATSGEAESGEAGSGNTESGAGSSEAGSGDASSDTSATEDTETDGAGVSLDLGSGTEEGATTIDAEGESTEP